MMPVEFRRSSIVSNSGTMLTDSTPSSGRSSPTSFSSSATSRISDTPSALEMTLFGTDAAP